MSRNMVSLLFAVLAICLLASCQSESLPLDAPTSRPYQPAPDIFLSAQTPTPTVVPTSTAVLTSRAVPTATATPAVTIATTSTVAPTPVPKPLAKLIDLQGAGRWRASVATDWAPAQVGQTLLIENQLLTESGTKAVIEYPDGLLVHVAPKTLFTVTDLQSAEDQTLQATLHLLLGQLFVSHTGAQGSQIRIATEAGMAGVRGTMLSVKVTLSGRVIVTCLEGTCTLENANGLIVLAAGKQGELLNAATPPIFLGSIANYQFNEWFANHPAALLTVLKSGLLAQLPAGCTLDKSVSCHIALACDPNSGVGCVLPANCDPQNGQGCELPGGCNPVTGQGCELPPACEPRTGQGCRLKTGCNLVTGQGCTKPVSCDPLSGSGCPPGAGCDLRTGVGCELPSGCNPITGKGCNCPGGGCTPIPHPSATPFASISTTIPAMLPATLPAVLPTIIPTSVMPLAIPTLDQPPEVAPPVNVPPVNVPPIHIPNNPLP